MKRIIFSIYTNKLDDHESANSVKRSQFEKFKHKIEESHKKYAHTCGAEYSLFDTIDTNYDNIQFRKILKLEELCDYYDEILYIDFDVVPQTNVSFFEQHNLAEHICCHGITNKLMTADEIKKSEAHAEFIEEVTRKGDNTPMWEGKLAKAKKAFDDKLAKQMQEKIKNDWNPMDVYGKICAKNAMLLLEDINGSNVVINTGVIGGSKKSIELLDFSNRLDMCDKTFTDACDDNIYPESISSSWRRNNEVYFSYILELYKVPTQDIGMQWNFILDSFCGNITSGAYFIHHVNKEFELSFS